MGKSRPQLTSACSTAAIRAWPVRQKLATLFSPSHGRLLVTSLMAASVCHAQAPQEIQIAAHVQSARAAESAGDLETAIREYRWLTVQLPDVAEIRSNLGIAYYQAKHPDLALAALQQAHTLNPVLYSPVLFSGMALYQLGRYKQGARELEVSCNRKPDDVLAQTWLAYSLVALSDYEGALKHLDVALQHQPNDENLLYASYQVHVELGKRQIEKLSELAPDSARVWQIAGDQWKLLGETDKAAALYKEAQSRLADLNEHRHTPEDTLFWSAKNHERAAQTTAERIIALAPDGARAHQISAEALRSQHRYDEAIDEYRKVLQRSPELPAIRVALGDLLLRTGHPNEALNEYDKEVRERPHATSVYFHKGLAFMMVGKEDEALSAFLLARDGEVDIPEVHAELGKLFLYRKDYPRALEELSKYVDRAPRDPEGHYMLMMAYRDTGNKKKVTEQLQMFQKLSVDSKQRNRAQEGLRQAQSEDAPVTTAGPE